MIFQLDKILTKGLHDHYERLLVPYANKSEKFLFQSRDYSKQFAHIYAFRLEEMTHLLYDKAREKWGTDVPVKKLCDLREDLPEKCALIGTFFKHQELKPSILREISEENQLIPQPLRNNYADENDKLILEDELQRIRLLGKINVHQMVTGIVCAVLGYVEGDGKFIVEDFMFYESGPQKSLGTMDISPLLVLISGLDQCAVQNYSLSLELFQQWLCGNIDTQENIRDLGAGHVVRVIIAGNSVQSSSECKTMSISMHNLEPVDILDAVKHLDVMFSAWSQSVNLDLMPGEFDPSNFMLPQQPFHSCMFPESSSFTTFKRVTNPYNFEILDRVVLGTAGQNIQDIMKTSKIEDPIEALRCSLKWGHIAPTSPDTLPCYPYIDCDPFIIKECPHVYFSGNHSEFKTDLYKGSDGQITRLICIPSFTTTQCIAVVNLRTLECEKISFKVNCWED